MADCTVNITTAGSIDLANYQKLTMLAGAAGKRGNQQIAGVCASTDATFAGTITVDFVLVDVSDKAVPVKKGIIAQAALTVSTNRSNSAGTGGRFLCTVAFEHGLRLLDLLGANPGKFEIYAGIVAAFPGAVTDVQLDLMYSPEV